MVTTSWDDRWIKLVLGLIALVFLTVFRTEPETNLSTVFKIMKPQGLEQEYTDSEGPLITLVTGVWAQDNDEEEIPHPHRAEVEASLIANLDNRYIHQVVVVLDSVSEDTFDCRNFTDRLISLGWQSRHPSHLSCMARITGQPSYYEMFRYTLHPIVEGTIVVLSNADQVFDDTIRYAKLIPSNVFWTLSTRGFSPHWETSGGLKETYNRIVNGVAELSYTPSYCHDEKYSLRWDSFIFQPDIIRRSLKASNFKRLNFYEELVPFYMHQPGAENAALHGVSLGLAKMTYWNACHLIASWHFHLADEMHQTMDSMAIWPLFKDGVTRYHDGTDSPDNQPSEFVPGPYAFIPLCEGLEGCFSSNHGTGDFYYDRREWGERHERPIVERTIE
jgi:hypothetical protein